MSNGIASNPALISAAAPARPQSARLGTARALFVAALIVSIAGCDSGAAPPQVPQATGEAQEGETPRVRYRVDPARNRVWMLTREGVSVYDATKAGKIAVPLPAWQWVGPQWACLPDLALGPKGEAVVTSNILPTLWRIDPETLTVTVHELVLDADTNKDVGFSGLVYSSQHAAFFAVSDLHGSLWRIDPLLRRGQKIALSDPIPNACGLAVRQRIASQKADRLTGLCARGPAGGFAIDFAPDQRSAYVRAAPCADH